MKTADKKFLIINTICPILLGALLYYIFFPEAGFVGVIDRVLGISYHHIAVPKGILLKVVRFYFLDFLWAYSFMSAMLLFGYDVRLVALAVIFEILMEVLQCISSVSGTFDALDIVVEVLADILVVFIFRRKWSNEKK